MDIDKIASDVIVFHGVNSLVIRLLRHIMFVGLHCHKHVSLLDVFLLRV